jgi:hypothetical protein
MVGLRQSLVVTVLAAACGGAPTPAPSTPTDRASEKAAATGSFLTDPCWPVAVMRIVESKNGEERSVVEMSGDGTMVAIGRDARHFLGRVSNDAVIDAHDVPSFTCIRREVEVPGGSLKGRYDASDAYVDARTRVAVGDDGSITLTLGTHPPETLRRLRVEGPIARARRTAELLVVLMLAGPQEP